VLAELMQQALLAGLGLQVVMPLAGELAAGCRVGTWWSPVCSGCGREVRPPVSSTVTGVPAGHHTWRLTGESTGWRRGACQAGLTWEEPTEAASLPAVGQ
jgi:hypothetical protein